MFQSLSQGALVYVLYKNEPRVASGKVMSVNTHMPTYNPNQPMAVLNGPVTDITVQIDNETIPFSALPANGVMANFPDKGVLLTEDRSVVLREIEGMATASRQILDQVPAHKKRVEDCEALLISLQPEKQKEAQQQQEIAQLKTELAAMNGKFDNIVEMLSAKFGISKTE